MASPIRTSESELKIAKLLPVDEWFNLHGVTWPLGITRVSIMLKGFLCVTKKRRSRSWYYITGEDPCPIAYPTGSLKNSSENIIRMDLKNLIQTNGKPKYRPIYKKEIKHESTD